jgi:hypothetical protein
MYKLFLLTFFLITSFSYACSGDCLSCHPALAKNILSDERHSPMLTCKACHMNEEAGMSECGKDCFECHDIAKIDKTVKEHDVIESCRECHMKMPIDLQMVPQSSQNSTPMVDFLLN